MKNNLLILGSILLSFIFIGAICEDKVEKSEDSPQVTCEDLGNLWSNWDKAECCTLAGLASDCTKEQFENSITQSCENNGWTQDSINTLVSADSLADAASGGASSIPGLPEIATCDNLGEKLWSEWGQTDCCAFTGLTEADCTEENFKTAVTNACKTHSWEQEALNALAGSNSLSDAMESPVLDDLPGAPDSNSNITDYTCGNLGEKLWSTWGEEDCCSYYTIGGGEGECTQETFKSSTENQCSVLGWNQDCINCLGATDSSEDIFACSACSSGPGPAEKYTLAVTVTSSCTGQGIDASHIATVYVMNQTGETLIAGYITSSGETLNIPEITDPEVTVMVAFDQDGVPETGGCIDLGNLSANDHWVFYNDKNVIDVLTESAATTLIDLKTTSSISIDISETVAGKSSEVSMPGYCGAACRYECSVPGCTCEE